MAAIMQAKLSEVDACQLSRKIQVAYELGISEITVKAHRGRMARKMDAGSLAGLVWPTASA